MSADYNDIRYVRRRYHAARQRLLYWSGNMTFTGKRWNISGPHAHDHDIMFELAEADCRRLEADIERLMGKAPKPYDPKAIEARRWGKINEAFLARREEGKGEGQGVSHDE